MYPRRIYDFKQHNVRFRLDLLTWLESHRAAGESNSALIDRLLRGQMIAEMWAEKTKTAEAK